MVKEIVDVIKVIPISENTSSDDFFMSFYSGYGSGNSLGNGNRYAQGFSRGYDEYNEYLHTTGYGSGDGVGHGFSDGSGDDDGESSAFTEVDQISKTPDKSHSGGINGGIFQEVPHINHYTSTTPRHNMDVAPSAIAKS